MGKFSRSLFLLLFLSIRFSFAQEATPLTQFFKLAERSLQVDFSYSDSDLKTHIISEEVPSNIQTLLQLLQQKTVFDYQLLPNNTIAVSLKKSVQKGCGALIATTPLTEEENFTIQTPYQSFSISGINPFYIIANQPLDRITILSDNFEPITLTISQLTDGDCLEIPVFLKLDYLQPVMVRQFLAKGISKEISGALKVNYSEFELLPGLIEPDVLQTLKSLPGIQSANESISFLNIRGGTNDQNLILWDGIKMYQNSHFFGLISAFNPYFTQEVSLIKNGTPSKWGDGVSGVIDMRTEQELNTEFSGGAGVNLLSADIFADIPLGNKSSVQVAGRKSINNLFSTPTFTSYFERAFQNSELTTDDDVIRNNTNFSFFDTSIRVLMNPTEKDQFRFNFIFLANSLNFNENAEINDEFQQRTSQLVQNNFSSSIWYKRQWNERFSTEAQFYGTDYKLESLNEDILNNQALNQENKILENNFSIIGNYVFSNTLNTQLGYQINETGITNAALINNPFFEQFDKQVILTNSIFAEGTLQISPKTRLTIGARGNHIGKFDVIRIEPRINFRQVLGNTLIFEAQAETKHQTTSQIIDLQEDFLGVENRRCILARPNDIPIVKSQQVSGGFTYNKKGWLVSTEGYFKNVDGITTQSQGFVNQFINERTHGEYNTFGAEILVNRRFKNVNTWFSYVYARNDYIFEDLTPSEFPNNVDIRHSLTYGINYSLKKFTFSAGFNWRSGIPTTLLNEPNIIDDTPNFQAPNSSNIDDYFRVDFSSTYTFPISNKVSGFVGLSLWNLLNTENLVNHFFRNNNGTLQVIDEEALGFTPNFTARIKF